MKTGTSSLMDGRDYKQNKVMRIDDINEFAAEQIKQNVQKLIDKDIFDQATLVIEERYGSVGFTEEIDAYFRGAKWMQENLKTIENLYTEEQMVQAIKFFITYKVIADREVWDKDIYLYIQSLKKDKL